MTRHSLLSLLAVTPIVAFHSTGRPKPPADRIVQLDPGTYTVEPGGGIWVSQDGVRIEGVRIERCTFEGATVIEPIRIT
jgi:hypothetical protein